MQFVIQIISKQNPLKKNWTETQRLSFPNFPHKKLTPVNGTSPRVSNSVTWHYIYHDSTPLRVYGMHSSGNKNQTLSVNDNVYDVIGPALHYDYVALFLDGTIVGPLSFFSHALPFVIEICSRIGVLFSFILLWCVFLAV